jgi:hypothetical protein
MRKSRFSDEQIIAILKEQEAGGPTLRPRFRGLSLLSQRMPSAICEKRSITPFMLRRSALVVPSPLRRVSPSLARAPPRGRITAWPE